MMTPRRPHTIPPALVSRLGLLVAAATLLWYPRAAVGADDQAQWINARDCGASGSDYQTTATTTAGSNQITVAGVGDFRPGQGVMVSRCNTHYRNQVLWGPQSAYAASRPLKDTVEIRGYDGSAGSWTVYALDVLPGAPPSFRWTDDIGRTWKPTVPITGDWQPLNGGTEVRFGKLDWESGWVVTFSARDQLVTTIEKIEGNVLTLKDSANRAATDAVVRHCDGLALQAAIDRGLKEKRNVLVPVGWYRLAGGLTVRDATGITIAGESAVNTVLDISEGEGACFNLRDGTEVTIKNFRMTGHSGFAERDQAGYLSTRGARAVWGFYLKSCNALGITNTERVLVENCHATRMSAECFYSGGRGRSSTREPAQYTKAITYSRCSVVDSARNAFNNNDHAENTSVLYCRIVDVGGCTWEGASRFVKFIGNYVRNAGTVAMGNVRSRSEEYEKLGTGQHIVADNTFESITPYGGCAIRAGACATQVVVTNNLFINFGSSAIEMSGATGPRDLPAGSTSIIGNVLDMTCVTDKPGARTAIDVSASDALVSDNQIYVRGACDPRVTAIRLREPALNLTVHDNLIRNCGVGIQTSRAQARVQEVVDARTFVCAPGGVPYERRQSHRYRGWNVVWTSGGKAVGQSVIESFDPETTRFTLREARETKVGDMFEVYPPAGANWNLHSNTLAACQSPLVLDSYGSPTSLVKANTVTRGEATGVKQAVDVRGLFKFIGNQFCGFDEPNSVVLGLTPARLGRPCPHLYRGNSFERCTTVVGEAQKSLWEAATTDGNLFLDCTSVPAAGGTAHAALPVAPVVFTPPVRPTLKAFRLKTPVTIDGAVEEWPWTDATHVAALAQTPAGDAAAGPRGSLLAARDETAVYLAVRVPAPPGTAPRVNENPYQSDGMEVSFQVAEPTVSGPIYMLWGSAGGSFSPVEAGGASGAQMGKLQQQVQFAARRGQQEWTCEWRVPFAAAGIDPAKTHRLLFNLGALTSATETWLAWVGTGAALYLVDNAGQLVLED